MVELNFLEKAQLSGQNNAPDLRENRSRASWRWRESNPPRWGRALAGQKLETTIYLRKHPTALDRDLPPLSEIVCPSRAPCALFVPYRASEISMISADREAASVECTSASSCSVSLA
jgi:hypothetical protein